MRKLFAFAFAFLFSGCTYITFPSYSPPMGDAGVPTGDGGTPVPDAATDPGPVVVIEALTFDDLTVMGGVENQGLVGYAIENRSRRAIEVPENPFIIEPNESASWAIETEAVFQGYELWSPSEGRFLAGPLAIVPTGEPGRRVSSSLDESYIVPPGERFIVFLQVDVAAGVNAGYNVYLGDNVPHAAGIGHLLPVIRYRDTGEDVAEELIEGNERIFRRVHVLSPLGGDVVVVANYRRHEGILLPNPMGQDVGQVCLTVYGGGAHLSSINLTGYTYEILSGMQFLDEGRVEHGVSSLPPGSSTAMGTFDERLMPGPSRCFDIHGVFAAAEVVALHYGANISLDLASGTAEDLDGASVPFVVSSMGASILTLRQTKPYVVRRELETHTIVNGVRLDLYQSEISGAYGRSLGLGSITQLVTGLMPGRTLSDFRVFNGDTELPTEMYNVYQTGTYVDLGATFLEAPLGSATYTVVFPEGMDIGAGVSLTVSAVPSGFVRGDSITVGFGDHWGAVSWSGTLLSNGLIDLPGLEPMVNALVWADEIARGQWTVAADVTELGETEVFTL